MLNGVEIPYKCACMEKEATVLVPFRRVEENIVEWMESCVQTSLYLDHRRRSPNCRSQKMEYAKIPLPENAPFAGAKPEVN